MLTSSKKGIARVQDVKIIGTVTCLSHTLHQLLVAEGTSLVVAQPRINAHQVELVCARQSADLLHLLEISLTDQTPNDTVSTRAWDFDRTRQGLTSSRRLEDSQL